MNLYEISALASVVGVSIIAVIPLLQDRKNRLYLWLSGMNFCIALWQLALYLLKRADSAELAGRISYVLRPFMFMAPFMLYHFILSLTKYGSNKTARAVSYTLAATTSVSIILNMLRIGVGEFVYKAGYGYVASLDITYWVFMASVVTGIVASFYLVLHKYYDRSILAVEKKQLQYLILGISIGAGSGLVTMLKIAGFNVGLVGPYGMLMYFLLVTYAILSYDLLNIRDILQKTLMYTLTAALVGAIFIVTEKFIVNDLAGSIYTYFIYFVLILLSVVALNPTLKLLDRVTKRVFFISNYDYQTLLQYVINEFRPIKTIDRLLDTASGNISGLLKLVSADIYIWDETVKKYTCHPAASGDRGTLDAAHPAAQYMKIRKDAVLFRSIYDDLSYRIGGKKAYEGIDTSLLVSFLKSRNTELFMPLTAGGDVRGFWLIGEKKNGETLRFEEINWLKNVAVQVSVMVENILLYDQIIHSERLVMLGQMAAAVAHEIRNPLTGLSSFIQMINDGSGSRERTLGRFLKIAPAEFKRLERLTDNLLALSHTTKLNLAPGDLSDIAKETSELLGHLLKKNKISVRENLSSPARIMADREQLQQVILNLIVNAVQAMPEGGELTITSGITEVRGSQMACLSVADSGIGIKPDIKDKIFEPFFTTKADGTGLGLAICRKIMQSHGGEIEAAPCPGGGSVFTLFFKPAENIA